MSSNLVIIENFGVIAYCRAQGISWVEIAKDLGVSDGELVNQTMIHHERFMPMLKAACLERDIHHEREAMNKLNEFVNYGKDKVAFQATRQLLQHIRTKDSNRTKRLVARAMLMKIEHERVMAQGRAVICSEAVAKKNEGVGVAEAEQILEQSDGVAPRVVKSDYAVDKNMNVAV